MLCNFKFQKSRWRKVFYNIFSFFLVLFFANFSITTHASVYAPGETLEPDCYPGTDDCGVDPALGLTLSTINSLLNSATSTNVGIGTTTPSQLLDVWGNLQVGTSSTPTLFVNTATGNVGVRTASPQTILNLGDGSVYTFAGNGLSWGDGDTGFYESQDDQIRVQLLGSAKFRFTTTDMGSIATGGGVLKYSGAGATVPYIYQAGELNSNLKVN